MVGHRAGHRLQPFYAFPHPRPDWDGLLADVAVAEDQPVTEAGYSRSGRGLWFAHWMAVLPPAAVASVLSQELARHGSRDRGTRRLLVRFDRGKASWGSGASDPEMIACPWRSAVLLEAGDKSGQWDRWYREAIPRAEQLYDDYLAERRKEMGT